MSIDLSSLSKREMDFYSKRYEIANPWSQKKGSAMSLVGTFKRLEQEILNETLFLQDFPVDADKLSNIFRPETKSLELSRLFLRSQSVSYCGQSLSFGVKRDESKDLVEANFCRDRFCPMCMWRKHLKMTNQCHDVYRELFTRFPKSKLGLLTLALRNCAPEDLEDEMDRLMSAWNRMTQNRRWKSRIKGYFRSFEVTYNAESHTFHPHFHVILVFHDDYSKKSSLYMEQPDWIAYWRRSAQVDYDPTVNIKRIYNRKNKNGKSNLIGAILETTKYVYKDKDIFNSSVPDEERDFIMFCLMKGLVNRRLHSFGGVLRSISRDLKLDELGEGDLVDLDGKEKDFKLYKRIYQYSWNYSDKKYNLTTIMRTSEFLELREQSKMKFISDSRLPCAQHAGSWKAHLDLGLSVPVRSKPSLPSTGFHLLPSFMLTPFEKKDE